MALDMSAVASAVVDNAQGGLVTLQSATLDGWYEIKDQALAARVELKGGASLVGSPTLTTPTILTIVVLGDSTAEADDEWVRLLVDLWVDRYGDWFHYVSLIDPSSQTYGWDADGMVNTEALTDSTRIVSVWNPSFGGAGFDDYSESDITAYVITPGADIVIAAQGINMQEDGSTIEPEFDEVEDWILAGLPNVQIVVSSENPVVGSVGSTTRDKLREVAQTRGYLFVDVYQAFINYGDWENDLLSDGIHPNATGSQLWADYWNGKAVLGSSSITLAADADWDFGTLTGRWVFGKVTV